MLATAFAVCGCSNRLLKTPAAEEQLGALRLRIGGRLGVHTLDTRTGRRLGYDDHSRFAMASTFKLPLAAAVLARVDRGEVELEQPVSFGEEDMLSYAPVASRHLERGFLSVRELCAAVVGVSDNVAANLLLSLVGGPAGFTQFMRSIGDEVTRLDRVELALNSNLPGDPRDTTSALAMVDSMRELLLGPTLSASSRTLLIEWLERSTTGAERIRAGLPADWRVGDKTGTGPNGAVNDVAIFWPPDRAPVLIAVYMSESTLGTDALAAAHAEVATIVARHLTLVT